MRKSLGTGLTLALVLALSTAAAYAISLQPMFELTAAKGECMVKRPTSADFEEGEQGKAFPYGSLVKTGAGAGTTARLADGVLFVIGENAEVTIGEDADNKMIKTLRVDAGNVETALSDEFLAECGLKVITPTALMDAKAKAFTLDVRTEHDLTVVSILCKQGTMRVYGPHFNIPDLNDDDFLSVASSMDRTFTRIKNIKGTFDVAFRDSDGKEKTVTTEPETVIKIWQRRSETGSKSIVTILVTLPDGTLAEAVTYSVDAEAGTAPAETAEEEAEPTEEPAPTKEGEWPEITRTPISTTTTTTTTIPLEDLEKLVPKNIPLPGPTPTPVGKR